MSILDRRRFLAGACGLCSVALARSLRAADRAGPAESRAEAMLIGSLIGDALGAPHLRERLPSAHRLHGAGEFVVVVI